MARYADFDAALARRGPLQFKLFGDQWLIPSLPFQRLAALIASMTDDAEGESVSAQAGKALEVSDFLASIVHDRAKWLDKAAGADLSTLIGVALWVAENEVGMPLKPSEDGDPLGASAGSLPPSPPNGPSSHGSSPPLGSMTP